MASESPARRKTPARVRPESRANNTMADIWFNVWDYGIEHVFGIPGDFVLSFIRAFGPSRQMVGCTREDNAGFAADAYARVHGMGRPVTFSVGGLSMCNSIAGAYAEIAGGRISGSRRWMNAAASLLHHRVRVQYAARSSKITVASASLDARHGLP